MSLTTTPLSPFLASDGPVGIVHAPTECTVAQAAEFLDVSEACVDGLLDLGVLEYRQDGVHRLINRDELFGYAERWARKRAALDRMVRMNQEMGLYDD